MQIHNLVLVRASPFPFVAAVVVLIILFEFCGLAISPAFAKKKGDLQELIINHGTTHYVAVNGSDNGSGTVDRPWATINYAAEQAKAGDTVVVRGGSYVLATQVRPRNSGRSDAWINYLGFPGEHPTFDAQNIQRPWAGSDNLISKAFQIGAFQIEDASYIRVANLTIINSHDVGFNIRDSSHIDLINNSTNGTYSSGIAVWDTKHEGKTTNHIRIIGNTVTRATNSDLAPSDLPKGTQVPQETISIGGAVDFEVAFNHIYDSGQAGIDIKETSKHGKVHHNHIDNVPIGIYVDAWFGSINDIDIYSNVIHKGRTGGIVLSVENGRSVDDVKIHNNLIFNNDGSGLYFSRWGVNNVRQNIQIYNNVFYHNGYGQPKDGQTYYWVTGGLYLYSTSLRDILIKNNIFSDNRGFQIGYSDHYLKNSRSWRAVARNKNIKIVGNLIHGRNVTDSTIKSGGRPVDQVDIYAVNGDRVIFGNPMFKDPANQDFSLRRGSPATVGSVAAGAYAPGSRVQFWWKQDFPPQLVRSRFDH